MEYKVTISSLGNKAKKGKKRGISSLSKIDIQFLSHTKTSEELKHFMNLAVLSLKPNRSFIKPRFNFIKLRFSFIKLRLGFYNTKASFGFA